MIKVNHEGFLGIDELEELYKLMRDVELNIRHRDQFSTGEKPRRISITLEVY